MLRSVLSNISLPHPLCNFSGRVNVNDGLLRILMEKVMAYFKLTQNSPKGISVTLEEYLVVLRWRHPENAAGVTAAQTWCLGHFLPVAILDPSNAMYSEKTKHIVLCWLILELDVTALLTWSLLPYLYYDTDRWSKSRSSISRTRRQQFGDHCCYFI